MEDGNWIEFPIRRFSTYGRWMEMWPYEVETWGKDHI